MNRGGWTAKGKKDVYVLPLVRWGVSNKRSCAQSAMTLDYRRAVPPEKESNSCKNIRFETL